MEQDREILEQIKASLTEMNIPYKEGNAMENQSALIRSLGYEPLPITVDITHVDTINAEVGIIVRKDDLTVDNGVYIFTVMHNGQAGFIVVEPSTITRAPLVRQVTGDIINAIMGIDLPPLMPFDMVEITAHMLVGTFMRMMMEACRIPKEYHEAFLRLYMPKFLANVGLYFVGATKDDGTPMIYEEIANMEPMMIWQSIQKGVNGNESEDTGDGAGNAAGETGECEAKVETENTGK